MIEEIKGLDIVQRLDSGDELLALLAHTNLTGSNDAQTSQHAHALQAAKG